MPHPIDRISHTMAFVIPVVEHWQESEIAHHRIAVTERPVTDQGIGARCSLIVEQWVLGSIPHGRLTEPFSFQPVHHNWYNNGRGMWNGAYKRSLAANKKKSRPCGRSGFSLSRCLYGPLLYDQHNIPINKIVECVDKQNISFLHS